MLQVQGATPLRQGVPQLTAGCSPAPQGSNPRPCQRIIPFTRRSRQYQPHVRALLACSCTPPSSWSPAPTLLCLRHCPMLQTHSLLIRALHKVNGVQLALPSIVNTQCLSGF